MDTITSKALPSTPPKRDRSGPIPDLSLNFCEHCKNYSIWVKFKMVYPKSVLAPLPLEDMPDDVKEDYLEARNIVNDSPRGEVLF